MFALRLLQLLLSPGNGWEDIYRDAKESPEHDLRHCYLPLIIAAGVSALVPLLYHHDMSLLHQVRECVVVFMMYFLGYYIGVFVLSSQKVPVRMKKMRLFVIYSLSLLAIISIVANVLPVTAALVFFLPAYVAIIMWKATKWMGVPPQDVSSFMLAAIFGVLLPPYLIYLIFFLVI